MSRGQEIATNERCADATAAEMTDATTEERDRCAKIAEAEEERHRRGSPVSSMAEDCWGQVTAKEIAAAIRDTRDIQ